MKKPKEITISTDDQFITIEMSVNDEDLIDAFFAMLKNYVKKRSPVKLTQAMVDPESFSKGTKIVRKTIMEGKDIDILRNEVSSATAVLIRKGQILKNK